MGGIAIPINVFDGVRQAEKDISDRRLEDARMRMFDQQAKSAELQQQSQKLSLEQARKNIPLQDMQRDASMVTEYARFGFQNVDRVTDQDLPAYAAKLFSDMPVHGAVTVQNGQLFDGQRTMPVTRDSLKQILTQLANPEVAMKMKMDEWQEKTAPRKYFNPQTGDVKYMAPGEAAGMGGYQDVANYEIGQKGIKLGADAQEAQAKAKYAGAIIQAELAAKRASAANSAASASYHKGMLRLYKDSAAGGRGVRLGGRGRGGASGGFEFSKQNTGDVISDVVDNYLKSGGARSSVVMNDLGETTKTWVDVNGKPLSADVLGKAQTVGMNAARLLSNGLASDVQDAYDKAVSLVDGVQTPGVQLGVPASGLDGNGRASVAGSGLRGVRSQGKYGSRVDGTTKGDGYFGALRMNDGSGKVATELGIGVEIDGKEMEIPSLVPTLSKQEVDYLLTGAAPTREIIQKASAHAERRIREGKSVWASPGEKPSLQSTQPSGLPSGARQAPDGNWYVQENGKTYRVNLQ